VIRGAWVAAWAAADTWAEASGGATAAPRAASGTTGRQQVYVGSVSLVAFCSYSVMRTLTSTDNADSEYGRHSTSRHSTKYGHEPPYRSNVYLLQPIDYRPAKGGETPEAVAGLLVEAMGGWGKASAKKIETAKCRESMYCT
jgi:hypothetical protein